MEYALTLDDLGAFRKTVQRKVRRQSQLLPLIALVLVVVSCVLWINLNEEETSVIHTLGLTLVVIIAFIFYRRHTVQKNRKCEIEQFAKTSLGETQKLRLDEKKLVIERKHHQSVWEWAAFENITTEGDAIYLWYSELEALIIPGRAFESEAERNRTVSDLRSKIR